MRKTAGLEYEASGDGEVVLLIHGALVADSFLPLMREAALVDRYRLIRYRRRGYGGSDPGAVEQAEKDTPSFFEVEFPAFRDWIFDADRARRISQPVLHLMGGDSGPLFAAIERHFRSLVPHTEAAVVPGVDHLMQMGDPKGVARPIADFLSRHPL